MHSLRGQLLVAGPGLRDPNFRRTVVLLGEHGDEGAMGVVLNRVSTVSVDEAVPPVAELVGPEALVHIGGPVQPQAVVVLADFVDPGRAGELVLDTVGFLPGDVEDGTELGELRNVRVFAGYAGWGPGQLEEELEEQSWVVLPARVSDVFTDTPDALWATVLRRQGGVLALLALLPDDPRSN
ncbi:YqgE/AlgH family protein [Gaiella sp.]|uniref:YqgE/AlgH family protein n=1 Tax=Gaiella sp. TaxID=2663207 RepID=UPI002E32416B|nr:YqgE/AlgH family protein [Gaiella sp.]HEX5584528.1 YqgE/AlgH family protein [Gaiella sp.]